MLYTESIHLLRKHDIMNPVERFLRVGSYVMTKQRDKRTTDWSINMSSLPRTTCNFQREECDVNF
jgi:hypothetical protein